MPEGDTIFRSARTLHRALANGVVTRFETRFAHLQRLHDDAPIVGRVIEAVSAAGKHLLISLSGNLVLRTHMRMRGSWHVYRPGERWRQPRAAMRIVIATEAFEAVAFDVPDAEWLDASDLRRSSVGRLGPDLLATVFDEAEAVRRLRAHDAEAIGEVLLDQRVVAGIGNVYRSEVLFLARVHPARRVGEIEDAALVDLLGVARRVMAENVTDAATAPMGTAHRRTTRRSNPAERLLVYGRHGRPCRRCGAVIVQAKVGPDARSVWWCPACQPAPGL